MLAFLEGNPRILTSAPKPVCFVEELQGTEVHLPNMNVYTDTWCAFGVEPVPMPASNFHLALRLGTIEGMENPIEVMYYCKIYEVSKYLMLTKLMRSGFFLIASDGFMEGLDPEHREVIREAAEEAQAMMAEKNAQGAASLYDQIETEGMTIVRDIDVAGFRQRAGKVHELCMMDQFGREAYDAALEMAGE